MSPLQEVYVYDAVRTPFGPVRGCARGDAAGHHVNRCAGRASTPRSWSRAKIACGEADVLVAGGVESTSRAPWVLPKNDKPYPIGDATLVSTTLGWRLVNPRMDPAWTVSLGEATEQLANRVGADREAQDEFALRSQRNAARAWDEGFYDDPVVPVPGVDLARDEAIRPDTSLERLAGLSPVFRREGGTVTADNASPLNNGAVELNEAFAAQCVACVNASGIDPAVANAHGGAIAIRHPLGASGTRVLGTLARSLRAGGHRWGVAAICVGVGQGLAVVLENVEG